MQPMKRPAFSDWIGPGAHALPQPCVSAEGPLDALYEDLVPGRAVRLIGWEIDQYALRVIYGVDPPLEANQPATPWELSGSDDLGNDYLPLGGAFGLARDREHTEGVQSLQLPHPSANYVDLVLQSAASTGRRHILRIELPRGARGVATQ
jgi:hypothetical protein